MHFAKLARSTKVNQKEFRMHRFNDFFPALPCLLKIFSKPTLAGDPLDANPDSHISHESNQNLFTIGMPNGCDVAFLCLLTPLISLTPRPQA